MQRRGSCAAAMPPTGGRTPAGPPHNATAHGAEHRPRDHTPTSTSFHLGEWLLHCTFWVVAWSVALGILRSSHRSHTKTGPAASVPHDATRRVLSKSNCVAGACLALTHCNKRGRAGLRNPNSPRIHTETLPRPMCTNVPAQERRRRRQPPPRSRYLLGVGSGGMFCRQPAASLSNCDGRRRLPRYTAV